MVGNVETSCQVVRWSHNLYWNGLSDSRLQSSYRQSSETRDARVNRTNCDSISLLRATVRSFHSRRVVYIDFDSRSNESRASRSVSMRIDCNFRVICRQWRSTIRRISFILREPVSLTRYFNIFCKEFND